MQSFSAGKGGSLCFYKCSVRLFRQCLQNVFTFIPCCRCITYFKKFVEEQFNSPFLLLLWGSVIPGKGSLQSLFSLLRPALLIRLQPRQYRHSIKMNMIFGKQWLIWNYANLVNSGDALIGKKMRMTIRVLIQPE